MSINKKKDSISDFSKGGHRNKKINFIKTFPAHKTMYQIKSVIFCFQII